MSDADEVRVTIRFSSAMAGEIDKQAAVRGESRAGFIRNLVAESLLKTNEEFYVPLITQAVRQELDRFEGKLTEHMLYALGARFDDVERNAGDTSNDLLRMAGALLWFSSFDEHRAEGGAMDAWLRLALMKSETVLSGGCLDDFDPESGGR